MSDGQIIHAPHTLKKAKVGSGPAKLDNKAIERAERAIKEMEKDYTRWAQEDLTNLEAALAGARRNAADPSEELAALYRIALDMKGQGTSFGFRLITEIGDLLTGFLEGRRSLAPFDCEIVAAHISAMRAIFAQDVRDDGGETGRALVAELKRLIAKAASGTPD